MSSSTPNSENANDLNQLVPCRGCTKECKYITKCEGKPWRMSEATILAMLADSKTDNHSR